MTQILVVEDDARTALEIEAALCDHGFAVDLAASGVAAQDRCEQAPPGYYSALVLDRMLPNGVDGLQVLTNMRDAGVTAPVLILSALSAVDERVRGLRAGGDDYLTKPFEAMELTARLDALIRRCAMPGKQAQLCVGDLAIDLDTRVAQRSGRVIDLLPREYMLLQYLMRHAGQVVTRAMLFEDVWEYHYDPGTNLVDVHIGNLRRKLEPLGERPLIHTVRGRGYLFRAD